MNNRLPSGGILPTGILNRDLRTQYGSFRKTFKNYPLRAGVIIASYPVSSNKNVGKLTTEYDVLIMEQDENKSITPTTYKNCVSIDGLGSIADYFEKS